MNTQAESHVVIQKEQTMLYRIAFSRLIWKLDRRLIPFLALIEIHHLLTGHVQLTTCTTDLNLTSEQNDWSISAFFLAYLTFAIPCSLMLRLLGPTRYLSLSLISWGAITIGMAFVTNAYQLIILRFLLGMAVAGYLPGIITYFSLWYRKREQIMRIAVFCSVTFASGALYGILVYGTGKMNGIAGLQNWRWLFLLPGLPIIPVGFITYLKLGNIPETVQWLDNCQKQLLTNLLRDDVGLANSEPASNSLLSWRQVRYVFVDWRIYLYALTGIGIFGPKKFLMTYLPLIVESMGYTGEAAPLMTIPPYILSCLCILLGGYSVSRRNEHSFHLAFFLFIGLLGFILMITLVDRGKIAIYVGLCIACCGTFSTLPIILSWFISNVGGNTKRTVAVGMMLGIAQIGGIVEPHVYRVVDKPYYRRGHIIASGFLVGAIILTFILRFCLVMENRRRKHLSQEEHDREAAIEEPCDWHPDNRYVL